jgi:hypothetical protein
MILLKGRILLKRRVAFGEPLKIHFEQKETKGTKIKQRKNLGLTDGFKLFAKKQVENNP